MPRSTTLVGALLLSLIVCFTLRGQDGACQCPACCDSSFSCGQCDGLCDEHECCDSFNDRQRLLGFLPSDHCFDRFISPISNPFFFEDPRSLTEARGLFLDNHLPDSFGGDDVDVWSAQFRGRVSDCFSVIAPRLAYIKIHPSSNGNPEGFLPAPVGVKYNFIRDVDEQFLVSAGMTYFIPGKQFAFTGGSGDFHFFLTAGKEIFDCGHWLSASGFRIPADSNWGTQLWYWSNQWDYELPGHIYPLVGINWFHWLRSAGVNAPIPVKGLDLIDIPAGGVAGSNAVTSVVGLKWKPNGNFELGGGYEFPLGAQADVLQNRAYFDVILRY